MYDGDLICVSRRLQHGCVGSALQFTNLIPAV